MCRKPDEARQECAPESGRAAHHHARDEERGQRLDLSIFHSQDRWNILTKPLFILGPGRSGTASFGRMLNEYDGIEAHHEFCNGFIQHTAVMWSMNLINRFKTFDQLLDVYGAALDYSDADLFVDASHKLSWLVNPLSELFQEAKFLHINRDGRVVSSEFYYKFHDDDENTIYEDRPVEKLQAWLAGEYWLAPPPDKRHRWKIPYSGEQFYEAFKTWNRFQRCVYHWVETNQCALEDFQYLPHDTYRSVHLEDIIKDETLLESTLTWAGIRYEHSMFEYLQTPRHVVEPINYGLTDEQQA